MKTELEKKLREAVQNSMNVRSFASREFSSSFPRRSAPAIRRCAKTYSRRPISLLRFPARRAAPRPGEEDAVDSHFLKLEDFFFSSPDRERRMLA